MGYGQVALRGVKHRGNRHEEAWYYLMLCPKRPRPPRFADMRSKLITHYFPHSLCVKIWPSPGLSRVLILYLDCTGSWLEGYRLPCKITIPGRLTRRPGTFCVFLPSCTRYVQPWRGAVARLKLKGFN